MPLPVEDTAWDDQRKWAKLCVLEWIYQNCLAPRLRVGNWNGRV
jgi:hypothetical protein